MASSKRVTREARVQMELLHCQSQTRNRNIAKLLGYSESAVAKVVREAYANGRIIRTLNLDGLTEEELLVVRSVKGDAESLKRAIAGYPKDPACVIAVPGVRVFDSGSTETTPAQWKSRLTLFGRQAAPYVSQLMSGLRLAGNSWGESVAAVVRGLAERPPLRPRRPIRFIPLCGDILDGPPGNASSSNLAYQLDEVINGDPTHSHAVWLAGVPARKPDPREPSRRAGFHTGGGEGFEPDEIAVIERYIHSLPAYRTVFGRHTAAVSGQKKPLVDQVQLILTSCGPAERPLGYGGERLLRMTGLRLRDARKIITGDLSGNLLVNPAASHESQSKVKRINAGWTGVKLHHIRECAKRARNSRAGGVVVCCIGANKVSPVLEVIRLGLANHLLVDHDLACQLERHLRRGGRAPELRQQTVQLIDSDVKAPKKRP